MYETVHKDGSVKKRKKIVKHLGLDVPAKALKGVRLPATQSVWHTMS